MKDYVLAESLISNDTTHAAGMQGHPQTLDDMTDGQIEDRFYQSVLFMSPLRRHIFVCFMAKSAFLGGFSALAP